MIWKDEKLKKWVTIYFFGNKNSQLCLYLIIKPFFLIISILLNTQKKKSNDMYIFLNYMCNAMLLLTMPH